MRGGERNIKTTPCNMILSYLNVVAGPIESEWNESTDVIKALRVGQRETVIKTAFVYAWQQNTLIFIENETKCKAAWYIIGLDTKSKSRKNWRRSKWCATEPVMRVRAHRKGRQASRGGNYTLSWNNEKTVTIWANPATNTGNSKKVA